MGEQRVRAEIDRAQKAYVVEQSAQLPVQTNLDYSGSLRVTEILLYQ